MLMFRSVSVFTMKEETVMEQFIQPYQYNFLAAQATYLMNSHRAVNDRTTLKTLRALSLEKINVAFPTVTAEEKKIILEIENVNKSQREIEKYLTSIRKYVIPFKKPSDPGLKKVFAKTKKLSIPHWDELDLQTYSFYGWNDPGQQRKYLILYVDSKLVGLQGMLEPNIHKGVCALCHETTGVALFTVKGKTTKDGNYTTKGNYICYDSEKCNHNIQRLDDLHQFVNTVKM